MPLKWKLFSLRKLFEIGKFKIYMKAITAGSVDQLWTKGLCSSHQELLPGKVKTADQGCGFSDYQHQMVPVWDLTGHTQQSVPSWLELKLAWAKKLELGWLGTAQRQRLNPGLARLGLKEVLNFRAKLSSGSNKFWIYEVSVAQAKKKWRFTRWAWLGLEGRGGFEIDLNRPIFVKLDLIIKFLPK